MPTIGCKSSLSREEIVGRPPRYFIYKVYTEQTLKHTKKACVKQAFLIYGLDYKPLPWHCLYFLPEPQGQGSLRPTFFSTLTGAGLLLSP